MIQSKLRNRFGLVKAGKLLFCYRMLREYDTVVRADNYFAEYRMLFLRRHSSERDIFRGSCIDIIKSRLRKNLKAPASSRIKPFLKEGEIRRRKKCSEHLKELDMRYSAK
jgi:hypothetical protein